MVRIFVKRLSDLIPEPMVVIDFSMIIPPLFAHGIIYKIKM